MSTTLDVSVVICAYTEDRWDELRAAVESIRQQSLSPLETIVVVDHNPRLLERIHAQLAGIIAIENHERRGLGGARNSGITIAKGAVIAFLDDDAIAAPDWLEQLVAGYEDANVIGVGGATDPLWLGGRPNWFPEEFYWVIGCSYQGMPHVSAPVRNLHGCNMSFRREVFWAVGNFHLGYGCDETELCIRVQRHWPHKILLFQPQARAYHQVQASRTRWRYFCSRCYFEGGSKAVVSWLQGAKAGLASERAYTLRVLPRGVVRGITDTILRRDIAGLARAGFIIAGLTVTTVGYLIGKIFTDDAARKRGWQHQ